MDPLSFAVVLVVLHGPDQQPVLINPMEIVSLRKPRGEEGHFAKGVQCLVHMADGKFIAVVEDCEAVRARVDEGDNSE